MKKILITLLSLVAFVCFSWYTWCFLQQKNGVYTGIGSYILKTQNEDTTTFSLNVSGLEQEFLGGKFGLADIKLSLKYQNITNLDIFLVAPDGERVELTKSDGLEDKILAPILFSDTASRQIFTAQTPYEGAYRPHGFIRWFNNHCRGNGTWKLKIQDTNRRPGRGVLVYWQLHFAKNPQTPTAIPSSPLPLVVINCPEVSPGKTHHSHANMMVIYHSDGSINNLADSANAISFPIEIKLRGNSSVKLPRKNYSLKTIASKKVTKQYAIAGIRAASEWVLGSNLMDRTLIRNPFTYTLYKNMGGPAVENKLCEVIWNNQYMGVYLLSEKPDESIIQTALTPGKEKEYGKQFVICKDNFTEEQTGWHSPNKSFTYSAKNPFLIVKYPERKKDAKKAIPAIREYFDKFDNLLAAENRDPLDTSYRALIDIPSFIDYMLINELSKNNDGYKLSCYFYRPYNGTLHSGPIWDFDRAFGNLSSDDAFTSDGWRYNFNDSTATSGSPSWWRNMASDKLFDHQLAERWEHLRKNELSDHQIEHVIDSLIDKVKPVTKRNFDLWQVFSIQRHGFYQSEQVKNFEDELLYFRKFIINRAHWMDAHVYELH